MPKISVSLRKSRASGLVDAATGNGIITVGLGATLGPCKVSLTCCASVMGAIAVGVSGTVAESGTVGVNVAVGKGGMVGAMVGGWGASVSVGGGGGSVSVGVGSGD